MAGKKTAEADVSASAFTREQILASKKYAHRRDLVGVLLKADKEYTLDQVDALINEFMERKVK